jgi:hypothetical protein
MCHIPGHGWLGSSSRGGLLRLSFVPSTAPGAVPPRGTAVLALPVVAASAKFGTVSMIQTWQSSISLEVQGVGLEGTRIRGTKRPLMSMRVIEHIGLRSFLPVLVIVMAVVCCSDGLRLVPRGRRGDCQGDRGWGQRHRTVGATLLCSISESETVCKAI